MCNIHAGGGGEQETALLPSTVWLDHSIPPTVALYLCDSVNDEICGCSVEGRETLWGCGGGHRSIPPAAA
jgi:hypothetical protein